ncbi:MAG: LysM peptidoglycan-binding domain-containing protein [Dehalococcoidia bacterium]|nr:LysM peptidoglycan-binding domain-containing protein [Dehalococcoidia bacterium]
MGNRLATVIPEEGLRLRRGPSTATEILGLLAVGQVVTITARDGDWRRVESPLGPGFVHGDYITVDGERAVNEEPPGLDIDVPDHDRKPAEDRSGTATAASATFYTVLPGDSLSAIGTRLGLSWRDIAAANGIREPFVISVNQVLRLPGAGVLAGTIDILNPIVFDGDTEVTSSSSQGHHTPYGGSRSMDLDVAGAASIGQPIAFNVAAPEGIEVRGVVRIIGPACRSGQLSDGGSKVQIRIEHRAAGGAWRPSDAWVLYAHMDPVLVRIDDVLAPGTVVGRMGPETGPEYDSSCAQGSHVHVEAARATSVLDVGTSIRATAVMRVAL